MMTIFLDILTASLFAVLLVSSTAQGDSPNIFAQGPKDSPTCEPTPPDMLGPFYKPNAPSRSHVGQGYVLSGTVKAAANCAPIAGARIEFWMAGPDGQYGDEFRGTMFSNLSGAYSLESHFPPPYAGRPSHIHLRITAEGYKTLVTQHYPVAGHTKGTFDLVLVPAKTN